VSFKGLRADLKTEHFSGSIPIAIIEGSSGKGVGGNSVKFLFGISYLK